MRIEASVDRDNIQFVLKELRAIDKQSTNKLRSRLRTGLGDVTAQIQADIPRTPPIRKSNPPYETMGHRGRTKWKGVNKPIVKLYGGDFGKQGHNLVVIEVKGGKDKFGFEYAELAGIRSRPPGRMSRRYTRRGSSKVIQHRLNGQGDAFIEALQKAKPIKGKAGRFAYDAFLKERTAIIQKTVGILDDFMAEYNRKFDARMFGI